MTERGSARGRDSLGSRDIALGAALVTALAGVVAALALALPDPPWVRAGRAVSFWLLSLPPLLLALPAWLSGARGVAESRLYRWLFGAALLAALVPEQLARGSAGDLLGPVLIAAVSLLLTADRPRSPGPLPRDLLLVAVLWFPLELGWVNGDPILLRLFGLDLLLLLYLVERPVFELGRLLPLKGREIAWGVGAWAGFLVPAIPIALITGFASFGLSQRPAGDWMLFMVSTFWIIALPEEALFRGVIQSLLQKAFRSTAWALALAAVIFGLSHLNNGVGNAPDWRYVLLASIAGSAYGLAYIKTRNLTAPVLTHFLVDLTWRGFFAGSG